MKFYLFALLSLFSFWNISVAKQQPNILWLTSEDNNASYLGCYGNELAVTPHLDRLADRGFRYTHCYSNGAVCSATRSSWIMGMISVSTGAHHHRSIVDIPESLIMYPQALSSAGYYTANGYKTDYNIQYDQELWNNAMQKGQNDIDWEDLKQREPFFQIINYKESHESQIMHLNNEHSPEKVKMAPYHPSSEISKKNTAVYYDAITRMDTKIGEALENLSKSGLAENTIVIYCSDHGGTLPRGKRFLYNSGTHCPLIIYIPEALKHLYPAGFQPGSNIDRLVSFSDMPTTWLSLAGAKIPKNYHGNIFLGDATEKEKVYHFSFRGRNGERVENVRAIRDKTYLLVKNYYPYVPRGQRQDYQWGIPMQQDWENEFKAGKLNPIQSRYFQSRGSYELYNTEKDPYCIHNQISNPSLQSKVKELKSALLAKQLDIRDSALIPESMLIRLSLEAGVTHYEFLQSESNYPIKELQYISDLALSQDPSNTEILVKALQHEHPAMRYWGAQGLYSLGSKVQIHRDSILLATNDDFDTVAISAAVCVLKLGEEFKAYEAIRKVLLRNPTTRIDILNQIAWLGSQNKPLKKDIASLQNLEGVDYQIQQFILTGKGSRKKSGSK